MEDKNNLSESNEKINTESTKDTVEKKKIKKSINNLKLISRSEKIIGLVILLAVLLAVAWAFLGRLETLIEADGVLSLNGNSIQVRAFNDSVVSDILVNVGDKVEENEIIAKGHIFTDDERENMITLYDNDNSDVCKSSFGGYITEISGNEWDLFNKYDPVFCIKQYDEDESYWVVYSVVSMANAEHIEQGMLTDIVVTGYSESTLGKMTGSVESVSYFPETKSDFAKRIGNSTLASEIVKDDTDNYIVQIKIDCNENGEPVFTSGLKVTDYVPINSRCNVVYHLKEGRPIDYIIGK